MADVAKRPVGYGYAAEEAAGGSSQPVAGRQNDQRPVYMASVRSLPLTCPARRRMAAAPHEAVSRSTVVNDESRHSNRAHFTRRANPFIAASVESRSVVR